MSVTPKAIEVATVAVHDVDCPDKDCNGSALGHACRLATAALEAAMPFLHCQSCDGHSCPGDAP